MNRPLPAGGNGYGAPARGTQDTAGALGMGTVKANAVSQSFSMLAYLLPMFFGYLSDAHTGRFKMILYGVAVFGVAHVLMVGATAPKLLANGGAKAPYFISLYMLSVGACMFRFLFSHSPFHPRTLPISGTNLCSHVQAQRIPPPPRPDASR